MSTEKTFREVWGLVIEQVEHRIKEEKISLFEALDTYQYPCCDFSLSQDHTQYYDVKYKTEIGDGVNIRNQPILVHKEDSDKIPLIYALGHDNETYYFSGNNMLLCPNGKIIKFD